MASLRRQTVDAYEVITIRERGPLAQLRNAGLRRARAPVVCIIDDDTVCPPRWLAGVLGTFQRTGATGVTGPCYVTPYWRGNRDLYRFPTLRRIHDQLFVEPESRPGHLTPAGTFNPCAADASCTYEGEVQFLEACNMSYKREALLQVGGFDESFSDLGEWSEPDCHLRMRALLGATFYFAQAAALFHQPARSGATLRRRRSGTRYTNYQLFAHRHVQPHWRATLYSGFLRAYFAWKDLTSFVH